MQYRRSRQREAILTALERQGGHLTADQIYLLVKAKFPRLSLGTVYRNLRILTAQGAVRELDLGQTYRHFELAKEAHYHLVCRSCGQVEDAEMPVDEAINLLAERSLVANGFKVEQHRLDFVGVCRDCQRPKKRSQRQRLSR